MEKRICELPAVRVLGRTTASDPLPVHWTGGGIEFDLRGASLDLLVEGDYEDLEPWISVLVNDHAVIRMPLPRGTNWLPLLRGLDPAASHRITILRESQPMPRDPRTCLRLHALRYEGEILPLPEPRCRLEFIGDSLTSAEGGLGGPSDSEWRPIWFTASENYAYRTARILGGEARILSQSGWGVRSSWDNDPSCNMPAYYEQVCGVVPEGGADSDTAAHDFASWKPDAVICALGSNDRNALGHEPFTDPRTGQTFAQRPETLPALEDAMFAFLQKLRRCNPDAWIAWMFFENEATILPVIKRAMFRFIATGEHKARILLVPPMRPTGARNHPGADVHASTAEALAAQVADMIGLEAPKGSGAE